MIDTKKIVEEYRIHDGDTGSPEIQIALLTDKIKHLSDHLQAHKRDFASRRGLLSMVGRRAKLLKYLKKSEIGRYRTILDRLHLRR
jgi:small subunit ribosomal protein S15